MHFCPLPSPTTSHVPPSPSRVVEIASILLAWWVKAKEESGSRGKFIPPNAENGLDLASTTGDSDRSGSWYFIVICSIIGDAISRKCNHLGEDNEVVYLRCGAQVASSP